MAVALGVEEVEQRFGDRVALRGVSFAVAPGECVALVGPNGAGKTTLLSILSGAQRPTAGRLVGGEGGIGWVPQQPALYRKLSVRENLSLFARLEGVADVDGAIGRMLDQTGLAGRAGDEVGTLSGGNQQRVNIALGLLADPAVLLLDEPSSSLDPRQRARLWEVLGGLGRTVVFSTHEVGEAERHADRVLVLADGELLFDGPPGDLLGGPHPEAAFVEFLASRGH